MEKELIKDWNNLVGLENDTYRLEINLEYGCGWIRRKSDNEGLVYLSTHSFYDGWHKYTTDILNSYGFNVELNSWG